MGSLTPKMGLEKPLPGEKVDVEVINRNYDRIDDLVGGGVQSDWEETSEESQSFIRNKPELGNLATKSSISLNDLDDYLKETANKAQSAIQNETDPTVPEWAKMPTKPFYNWSEIANKPEEFLPAPHAHDIAQINGYSKMYYANFESNDENVINIQVENYIPSDGNVIYLQPGYRPQTSKYIKIKINDLDPIMVYQNNLPASSDSYSVNCDPNVYIAYIIHEDKAIFLFKTEDLQIYNEDISFYLGTSLITTIKPNVNYPQNVTIPQYNKGYFFASNTFSKESIRKTLDYFDVIATYDVSANDILDIYTNVIGLEYTDLMVEEDTRTIKVQFDFRDEETYEKIGVDGLQIDIRITKREAD